MSLWNLFLFKLPQRVKRKIAHSLINPADIFSQQVPCIFCIPSFPVSHRGFFKLVSSPPSPLHPSAAFCCFGGKNLNFLSWLPGLCVVVHAFINLPSLFQITPSPSPSSIPRATFHSLQCANCRAFTPVLPSVCKDLFPRPSLNTPHPTDFGLNIISGRGFPKPSPFQLDTTCVILITPWTFSHSTEHNL